MLRLKMVHAVDRMDFAAAKIISKGPCAIRMDTENYAGGQADPSIPCAIRMESVGGGGGSKMDKFLVVNIFFHVTTFWLTLLKTDSAEKKRKTENRKKTFWRIPRKRKYHQFPKIHGQSNN